MPPTPPRRRRTALELAVVGALVAVVAVGAVLVATHAGPSGHRLTIEWSLMDAEDGGDCASGGTGGYEDIRPGMPLTVTDETGKVLASTMLPDTGEDIGSSGGCTWTMQVTVPDDATQYGIEAGRRGTVTYSHEKLVEQDWTVQLGIS